MRCKLVLVAVYAASGALVGGCVAAPRASGSMRQAVDDRGCALPEPARFTSAGVKLDVAQTEIGKLKTQGINFATTPQVINLLSQSATDKVLLDYYNCRADNEPGLDSEQRSYFRRLRTFMEAKPTAAEILEWGKSNPWPARSSPTGNGSPGASNRSSVLPPVAGPVFEDQQIRATVERLFLSADGWRQRRVTLTIVVDNLTPDPIRIALEHNGLAGPRVSLSDDRGTTWYYDTVSGMEVLPCCNRNLRDAAQTDFTVISPKQRVRVSLTLTDDNNGMGTYRGYVAPGSAPPPVPTEFNLTMSTVRYTAAGPERVSVQLGPIKRTR